MTKIRVPPIKCQGIKTKLVPWIKSIIPDDFDGRWIEPFLGSGVVVFNVMPEEALLCDTNPHVIALYRQIQDGTITEDSVRSFLKEEGAKLKEEGEDYYYEVRERFNDKGEAIDFLFLNRSCFNGMIRFNRKGKFNVPFCKKPERFAQAYITKISNQVRFLSGLFVGRDYRFECQDFSKTISEANEEDLVYCDPPYIGRHVDYFNGWGDQQELELCSQLGDIEGKFILSTWHSNDYRENTYLDSVWSSYDVLTREHFYHVGGSEKNRNPMLEALVTNFPAVVREVEKEDKLEQSSLF